MCPGLTIEYTNENTKDSKIKWFFENGLKSYLEEESNGIDLILKESIVSSNTTKDQEVEFVINWAPKFQKNKLDETYVNLIPTAQGGSHLNGFKSGLLEALKEFCDYRSLLPKGLKLNADDVLSLIHI